MNYENFVACFGFFLMQEKEKIDFFGRLLLEEERKRKELNLTEEEFEAIRGKIHACLKNAD